MGPALRILLAFGLLGLVGAGSVITLTEVTPFFPLGNGSLILQVRAAPPDIQDPQGGRIGWQVDSLNITIDFVQAHRRGNLDVTGGRTEVVLEGPTMIDLTEVTDIAAILAAARLPEGTYIWIRLHVTDAVAQISTGQTSETVQLNIPGNDTLKVNVRSFEVRTRMTTTVELEFVPHIVCPQSQMACKLTPVLRLSEVRDAE